MPTHFAESSDGTLFLADGFGDVLKWDGLASQAVSVGIIAPATALSMSASGVGSIVGEYTAFSRFVDGDGRVSNLSPISSTLTAQRATGSVTGATNATPIVVTSTGHGLLTGAIVKISDVLGNTGANGTWTITVLTTDTFSLNGSAGNGTLTAAGAWIAGVSTITFTSVPTSSEAKVVRRQILRNTDGQATTYYVDIDTTDLGSTTFSSTKDDDTLSTGTAVPLLDSDGSLFANRHDRPPNDMSVLANHLGRMFAAVPLDYTQGSCQTTFGSTTVTGIGTEWEEALEGRELHVKGASRAYEISSVDESAQTMQLTTAYLDSTDKFALYAIRPFPSRLNAVPFSESALPESWPPTNVIVAPEDGDRMTGLMAKGSFLYFLKRRHMYRFTAQSDPGTDGFVFLSSIRGCINQRCWVLVEDVAYMLDEGGIHAFTGGQQSDPISTPIQDLFRPSDYEFEINWRASEFFHASHYPNQETIRWFVAMTGEYLPHHAIVYNYRTKRWWLEEFASPIGASCTGRLNEEPKVFLGSDATRVLAFWEGTLDGPDPDAGTVRGTVTE